VSGAIVKIGVIAASLALDVFAVSIGVGMRGGMTTMQRVRIGLAFASAEVGMNLIGVGLGAVAGKLVGSVAAYLGFAALVGVGIYMVYESVSESDEGGFDLSQGWGLFVGALSISLDSLGIGFSILFIGVPLVVSMVVIACSSLASTAAGLTFGRFLGAKMEASAALWAGIILILTGVGFAALHATGHG
jgi:putative Mn2+ efflux pump MntP